MTRLPDIHKRLKTVVNKMPESIQLWSQGGGISRSHAVNGKAMLQSALPFLKGSARKSTKQLIRTVDQNSNAANWTGETCWKCHTALSEALVHIEHATKNIAWI